MVLSQLVAQLGSCLNQKPTIEYSSQQQHLLKHTASHIQGLVWAQTQTGEEILGVKTFQDSQSIA
ncbi:hypothetical protein C500_14315 [Natrialba magadii ATCC 43099]|uniref:Uncharacterized protein n=1 Tax=Natrialba magadii (strain ATCC 43099 / DSM 3394 / CCM 3739 / CIP 104546 / IAM 13178 / JCM 8861 / NBRC 102185 / NCIMB 2190 / MS3) TaxID=547559 RepID=L9US77_NATMM|nr:hypothetical protein C500_14315 [Natrialba magadii ATCC 43099]